MKEKRFHKSAVLNCRLLYFCKRDAFVWKHKLDKTSGVLHDDEDYKICKMKSA